MMTVKAFQIDDLATLTVKDGAEMVISGIFAVVTLPSGRKQIDLGKTKVNFRITHTEEDPAVVGTPARPGQRRIFWSGESEE